MSYKYRVASDVGGTFTDLVVVRDGQIQVCKAHTTPEGFEQGVLDTLEKARVKLDEVSFLVHGTTVVINTLLERKGVKTGLITTRGFRDVLEIARGNSPDIYNVRYRKPEPFVPRELRVEVTERVDALGNVITPLDEEQIAPAVEQLLASGVEAIAVVFLHAYANPNHEQRVVACIRIRHPELAVIPSHAVCAEWREYERTNTAVLSAYVMPPTRAYLDKLALTLSAGGLDHAPYIMQSNGGIATMRAAARNPITLIESGPAGGMLAAATYGGLIGESNMLALDIGGTTAKCTLIRHGQVPVNIDYVIEKTPTTAGYPVKTPVVDIVEIGNGGGSLAWLDAAGSLHVGPHSAGSIPGPVAYGLGGKIPTTTDANLLTGRISPDLFVGGSAVPDMQTVLAACNALAEQLAVDVSTVARGILRIANANMANALKLVSVGRGHDPRDFCLLAFGGGGAVHATALARDLNIPRVIIPPHSAVFSAWGMLMTDLRRDYLKTQLMRADESGIIHLADAFKQIKLQALDDFEGEGFGAERVRVEHYVELRYQGQEHTVKVAFTPGSGGTLLQRMCQRFHAMHEQKYSFRLDNSVEIVTLHLVAFGTVEKSDIRAQPTGGADASGALTGVRTVDFDQYGMHAAATYDRERLSPGMCLSGPAIIEEVGTSALVFPGDRAEVDRFGGLCIAIGGVEQ